MSLNNFWSKQNEATSFLQDKKEVVSWLPRDIHLDLLGLLVSMNWSKKDNEKNPAVINTEDTVKTDTNNKGNTDFPVENPSVKNDVQNTPITNNTLPINDPSENDIQKPSSLPEASEKKEYILSLEDYKKYFEWDNFEQDQLWNCYLLATIDSYTSWGMAEDVTRKSISVVKNQNGEIDSIHYFLPLWAPKDKAKEYIITKEIFEKYKNHETKLAKQGIKDWLLGLMIAYGQISTGQKEFDPKLLKGGFNWSARNTLIFGINTYNAERNYAEWETNFLQGLEYVAKTFNKKTDMLSFGADIALGSGKPDTTEIRKKYPELWKRRQYGEHAYAIEDISKDEKGVMMVSFSNPWKADKTLTVPFSEFAQFASGYSFSSTRTLDEISKDEVSRLMLERQYSNETDEGKRVPGGSSSGQLSESESQSDTSVTRIISQSKHELNQMSQIKPISIDIPKEVPTKNWGADEKYGEEYREWEVQNNTKIRQFEKWRMERETPEQLEVVRPDVSSFSWKRLKNQPSHWEGIYINVPEKRTYQWVFNQNGQLTNGKREVQLRDWTSLVESGDFKNGTEQLEAWKKIFPTSDGKLYVETGKFDTNKLTRWQKLIPNNNTILTYTGEFSKNTGNLITGSRDRFFIVQETTGEKKEIKWEETGKFDPSDGMIESWVQTIDGKSARYFSDKKRIGSLGPEKNQVRAMLEWTIEPEIQKIQTEIQSFNNSLRV